MVQRDMTNCNVLDSFNVTVLFFIFSYEHLIFSSILPPEMTDTLSLRLTCWGRAISSNTGAIFPGSSVKGWITAIKSTQMWLKIKIKLLCWLGYDSSWLGNSSWLKWQCWSTEHSPFEDWQGDLLHLVSDTVHSMTRRRGGWPCHWQSAVELDPPRCSSGHWWGSRR